MNSGLLSGSSIAARPWCADGGASQARTLTKARCPVPGARCPVSGVRCPVSGVRCPVPGVRCPVPGVRCPVSGVRCPVSGRCLRTLTRLLIARACLLTEALVVRVPPVQMVQNAPTSQDHGWSPLVKRDVRPMSFGARMAGAAACSGRARARRPARRDPGAPTSPPVCSASSSSSPTSSARSRRSEPATVIDRRGSEMR